MYIYNTAASRVCVSPHYLVFSHRARPSSSRGPARARATTTYFTFSFFILHAVRRRRRMNGETIRDGRCFFYNTNVVPYVVRYRITSMIPRAAAAVIRVRLTVSVARARPSSRNTLERRI